MLLAWLGLTDLDASRGDPKAGEGPIAQALRVRSFDEAVLLWNGPKGPAESYTAWLKTRAKTPARLVLEPLSSPMNYGEIYEAAVRTCQSAIAERPRDTALSFHLSPGTSAMAAVWLLLGKTRFPAELLQSSKDHGVQTAVVPFDIAADFLPDLLRDRDERLRQTAAAQSPEAPEFGDILHRSPVMERLIARARRVAPRDVPVLIEGESGTGKEMLARAIHKCSGRATGPFVPVNCGALSPELVESELFGHEKGAFTGATKARAGYFEAANGGTLFLDEVGELPLPAQVKLLRVLQERELTRVGSTKAVKVDVRIVAATNRTLTTEVAAGRFREDLFYRLAVAVLNIPALRERAGDVGYLVDHLWDQVNRDLVALGSSPKKLTAGARNVLLTHPWPGNVRELANTLRRIGLWSESPSVSADEAREALLSPIGQRRQEVLGRPLGDGLDLEGLLRDVARHYLSRAMTEAHGNKTEAAKLVGLPSYQTLTNWLDRHGLTSQVKAGKKSA